jgi:hypothetical protein
MSDVTRYALGAVGALLLAATVAEAQAPAGSGGQTPARTGRQVYESICITCHGPAGRGGVNLELEKIVALPDFSDCSFARREPDADWIAVAHQGGAARGFSPLMPPWGGTFTIDELELAVSHLRTFCTDDRWPRGELNLPRPLVTAKAFPEDEAVVSVASQSGKVVSSFIYEKRFGPLNQWEVVVPIASIDDTPDGRRTGVGDIALEYKRTLVHSLDRGRILSATAEVKLPTGNEDKGFGEGTVIFEPFLTFGQVLPRESFLQAQAGIEFPASGDHDNAAFWRAAIGKSFEQGRFGRTWSPMVELLGSKTLASGAAVNWDVVPQVQVTLNKRQHIRLNGGVRLPVTDSDTRSKTVIVYLLWDWYDGGFLDGW